eukprot:181961-Pelagomonas_calceolata.AAC.1
MSMKGVCTCGIVHWISAGDLNEVNSYGWDERSSNSRAAGFAMRLTLDPKHGHVMMTSQDMSQAGCPCPGGPCHSHLDNRKDATKPP